MNEGGRVCTREASGEWETFLPVLNNHQCYWEMILGSPRSRETSEGKEEDL